MNPTRNRIVLSVLLLLGLTAARQAAGDWPQYEGPNRNATSPETGILRQWPAEGPKVLWSGSVGLGYGGAAIKDGKVYLLDRPDDKQDVVRCLALETGAELWRYAYDAPGQLSHDGSRSVPSVDDKYVYTIGPFGDILCVDLQTHQQVWRKNLLKDFGAINPRWGVAQSPTLHKDFVLLAPFGEMAGMVALHKATGEVAWKSERLTGNMGYATPLVWNLAGKDQVVVISASGRSATGPAKSVYGLDPANGKVLWSYDGWKTSNPIPSAALVAENRLFVTAGYRAGSALIEIAKDGEACSVKEIFKLPNHGSQLQQPLVHDGHIYMDNNENQRQDGLLCLTLTGDQKWRTRDIADGPRYDRGNLLLADGLIFAIDKAGALRLFQPNPEGYKELGSVKLLDGNELWGLMALSRGRLVIRDHSRIICLAVGALK